MPIPLQTGAGIRLILNITGIPDGLFNTDLITPWLIQPMLISDIMILISEAITAGTGSGILPAFHSSCLSETVVTHSGDLIHHASVIPDGHAPDLAGDFTITGLLIHGTDSGIPGDITPWS